MNSIESFLIKAKVTEVAGEFQFKRVYCNEISTAVQVTLDGDYYGCFSTIADIRKKIQDKVSENNIRGFFLALFDDNRKAGEYLPITDEMYAELRKVRRWIKQLDHSVEYSWHELMTENMEEK